MKGMPGIVIAAALGIVGAFCNWFYVNNQARNYEIVAFVAIGGDADLKSGDRFRDEHFAKVEVPKKFVGGLGKVAVHWDDRATIEGRRATKGYHGREILFWRDLDTPAQQDLSERLGKTEVLFQVVVDSGTFIPQHYDPGDLVRFFNPLSLEMTASNSSSTPPTEAGSTRTVGPFRILALGGRKGKRDLAAAYNRRPVRENVLTIALEFPFDSKADELFRLTSAAGNRGVRIIKHKTSKK